MAGMSTKGLAQLQLTAEPRASASRWRGTRWREVLVGVLVARKGRVVGIGHHRYFGAPHAEVEALLRAGAAGRGATLYTTLEPCTHQGKTPPCVDAIVQAGIRKVISSMADPDPRVAGRGFRRLRGAGIGVDVGLGRVEAEAR